MKYFLALLHSSPSIHKISYEKARSLMDEYGYDEKTEVDYIYPPYPYDTSVQCIMLTDDLLLLKWNK